MNHNFNKINQYIGKKYYKLTLLEFNGVNSGKNYLFKARCDCGIIRENVNLSNLKYGKIKSCGCTRTKRKQTHCNIKNCSNKFVAKGYCGKHLSRLYIHGDPNKLLRNTGCIIPDCQLKHFGRGFCSKHYNQYRQSSGYKAKFERTITYRFTKCKRYAKSRDRKWDISFDEYKNLVENSSCYYCSGPLPQTSVGLDRKDNNKDYLIDNVIPCCRYCNSIKSDIFLFEEFVEFSKTDLFKRTLNRLHHTK